MQRGSLCITRTGRLVGGGAPTPSFQLPMTDRTAQAMLFIRRVNARAGSNLEPFDYHYD